MLEATATFGPAARLDQTSSVVGVLAHRGNGYDPIVAQLFTGTEGIYGIPTMVSATYIFLFHAFPCRYGHDRDFRSRHRQSGSLSIPYAAVSTRVELATGAKLRQPAPPCLLRTA
jgi:hypothetical protein